MGARRALIPGVVAVILVAGVVGAVATNTLGTGTGGGRIAGTPAATLSAHTPPEAAAIREAFLNYWTLRSKYNSTLIDSHEAAEVATGEALTHFTDEIKDLRKLNSKYDGGPTFRDVSVGEPTKNAVGVTTAEVTYCRDESGMKVAIDTTESAPC